ncbi:MAG: hypothetical protein KDK36_05735, partial [Leptospiraceae bacterium]|nr:hypothetical protein [Leptospiraceae bacterium]
MLKKDSFILFLSAITLIFLIFLYFFISNQKIGTDSDPVGKIIYRHKIAQRKDYSGFLWENLDQEDIVFNKDSIRTDEFAEAIIEIKSGSKIELDPMSMVVLNISDNKIDIILSRGSIHISNVSNSLPINILTEQIRLNRIEGSTRVRFLGETLSMKSEKEVSVKYKDKQGKKLLPGWEYK